MKRRWAERIVLVVAVLACIATSRPSWSIYATLLPEDITRSRIIEVEATQAPDVMTQDPKGTFGGERGIRPLGTHAWPGKNKFLISAGRPMDFVLIDGKCANHGGCFGGGRCVPPAGAAVKMLSNTPVQTWRLEANSGPQSTVVEAQTQMKFRVPLTHSHPLHVHLEPWNIYNVASVELVGDIAVVSLGNYQKTAFTVGWTLAADTEELCADPQVACTPPEGATLVVGAPHEPTSAPF